MSSKQEQKVKKLVLVLTNSMLLTVAREKTIRNARTTETDKNSEYLGRNLTQISCI